MINTILPRRHAGTRSSKTFSALLVELARSNSARGFLNHRNTHCQTGRAPISDEQRFPTNEKKRACSCSSPIPMESRTRRWGPETARLVEQFSHPTPILLKVQVVVSHSRICTHAWCKYATMTDVGPRTYARVYVAIQALLQSGISLCITHLADNRLLLNLLHDGPIVLHQAIHSLLKQLLSLHIAALGTE